MARLEVQMASRHNICRTWYVLLSTPVAFFPPSAVLCSWCWKAAGAVAALAAREQEEGQVRVPGLNLHIHPHCHWIIQSLWTTDNGFLRDLGTTWSWPRGRRTHSSASSRDCQLPSKEATLRRSRELPPIPPAAACERLHVCSFTILYTMKNLNTMTPTN